MARTAKHSRHDDGDRVAVDKWERWQALATIARLVIEVLELADHWFGGGGPGRLL